MPDINKIHQLVEQQALKNPHNIAVRFKNESLTYQELNIKANQLAHRLTQIGVQANDLIPIISEKSIASLIARLAVLKTGAAFVPLNPDIPPSQLAAIFQDTQTHHVFAPTDFSLPNVPHFSHIQLINLDTLNTLFSSQPSSNLSTLNDAKYAYVIYTSGTTGRPKGVLVTHDNVLQTYASWEKIYALNTHDTHLQMASVGFDVEIGDIVRAWGSGSTLVLCPKETLLNSKQLIKLLSREKITCAEFVPSILRPLLQILKEQKTSLPSLRLLICGSDQWTMGEYRATKKILGDKVRVINSYGLTEATIDSTYFEETQEINSLPDTSLVPIGQSHSFPHAQIYLLNDQLQPIQPGEIGEIWIAGPGVAAGYLNLPELTKERFLKDPFLTQLNDQVYRTGDQGYLLPDGNIAFLGRNQMHVKIDGKRIDLPSLEAILGQHPKIKQAIVIPQNESNKVFFQCFLLLKNRSITYEEVTSYLNQHVIGAANSAVKKFYLLDKIPLTINGKIDRNAITSKTERPLKPSNQAPLSPVEKKLHLLWQELLEINDISISSNFRDIGGSSLLLVAMTEKINRLFNLNLTPKICDTTIQNLAKRIQSINNAERTHMKEKNSTHKIAVVGGGPAAISLCLQLLEECRAHPVRGDIEISVFEKNDEIGPGLPYASQENSYILNLPKGIMEPVFGQKDLFSKWLKTLPEYPKDTEFPPRYYFGLYLKHLANEIQQEAESLGIKINYLTNNEVISIQKDAHGQFVLESEQGSHIFDYTVLCTGHMPSSAYSKLIGKKGYEHNPWFQKAYDTLDPNDNISVIGTRLTAIDVACKLFGHQHKGKISLYSRNGLLPAVLSKEIPEYPLKYLTLNNFFHLTKSGLEPLKLNTLLELFWKEINAAQKSECDFKSIAKTDKDITPLSWINKEIEQAEKGPKPWQQVLFALYPIVPSIWAMMDLNDQQTFLEKYYSTYMTYLAAFPLDNAYKIKNYLESGQLEVRGGLTDIDYENGQFTIKFNKAPDITTQHIFNATGPSYDPTPIPLCKKMLGQGIASKHPLGGINVDPQTLQVLDIRGKTHFGLFAIGELTRGATLATTDMTRVSFQASKVATGIARGLFITPTSHSRYPFFSTTHASPIKETRKYYSSLARSSFFNKSSSLQFSKTASIVAKGLRYV